MLGRSVVGIVAFAWIVAISAAQADVTLPAIISDNMVLQVGHELTFWGWADPGEEVSVTITSTDPPNGVQTNSVATAADGRWQVKFPARTKPGHVAVKVNGKKNSLSLANVVVGDVWVCSGQSNMEWPVSSSLNHEEEIAKAKLPLLRVFKVERNTSLVPQTHLEGQWIECSPETVAELSAVAYFFGRELHQKQNRPIGLIQASQGGASCEAWTSLTALKSDPDFAPILARADKANGDPNQANNPNRASVLFNGMIAPLQAYSIKGTIWYQGETNAPRALQYRKLFPLMITDWRRGWGQGDFPFLFVQLANYVSDKSKPDHPPEPEESAWAELREAQAMTLSLPKTGMATTIDIGDARDINPKNKQDVGHRLALSALRVAYAQDIVASGPSFKSMKIVGREVRIEFDNAGGGLVARGGALKGFAIAGADMRFVWADAKIEGAEVVVSAASIETPVAIRYAWGDNPQCSLFNVEGLPAVPFRTDTWPGITAQSK